jgi:Zn-dependent M28 family amino/carboxypeptidase
VIAVTPLFFLASGMGANLAFGRLSGRIWGSSPGAVDNGAACAILLGLAARLHASELRLKHTRLTLALFTGEEVNMQGSRAYVRSRGWPVPAAALNLEVMAQDGEYVYWEMDGSALRLAPTHPGISQAVSQAVEAVTGQPAVPAGPITSDGGSFILAGIPTAVLGTYHSYWRDRGFHRPSDNLERIMPSRLPEGVDILARFIQEFDRSPTLLQQGSE